MSAASMQSENTTRTPAEISPGLSLIAIAFFGPVATFLTLLVWVWPDSEPLTPLGCLALSVFFFAAHLALCGNRIGAFDPALWIPVLMIFHYFGMVIAVELIPGSQYFTYDVYGHGVPQIARGFAMALAVLALYLFGFHLLPTYDRNRPPDPPKPAEPAIVASAMTLMIGGVAMMIVGIPVVGTDVLFGAYGTMTEAIKFGLTDFRLIGAGFLFAAGGTYGVIATAERLRSTTFRIASWCAVFIFGFLVLTGDRTGMSLTVFAGGWALTQRVMRVPRWLTIGGFVFMFLLMPVIKEYREYRDVEDAQTMSVAELGAATFYEMGSSVSIYSYTVDRIPSEKAYNWGASIVVQFIENVPNVLGGAGFRLVQFDPLTYLPSKWVTWTASPNKYYNAGGGYGYAVGAEWYFNFGFPGLYLGMIWMGWMTALMRNRCRASTMWLIVSCLYFGLMVVAVRNAIGYPMRTMMWPLVGFLVLNGLFRFMSRPKRRPIEPGAGFDSGAENLDQVYPLDGPAPFHPPSADR